MALQQGTIVWAVIADKNGHNSYGRPVIIITADAQIDGVRPLIGVVASHTATHTKPRPDTYVELPWHPSGRVATNLRKPTVAVCDWLASVEPQTIAESDIGGRVPASVMVKILEIVHLLRNGSIPT